MKDYSAIGPTAYSVARSRALSDIPLAKEIADWATEKVVFRKDNPDSVLPRKVLNIEARYKLIDKVISKYNPVQILELASGLLPRGYLFAKKGVTFVETDLPEMMEIKKRMLNELSLKIPPTLFLEKANALDLKALENACKHFDSTKPIAIINEGLLRYLNFEEKTIVAQNVHSLLERFGGVWVTSDITLAKRFTPEKLAKIKNQIGMDVTPNLFKDLKHAKKFFTDLGFKIKIHPFKEIYPELVSHKGKEISAAELKYALGWYVVEMRVK
jgi:O-methyltransferase involved in polyketide biosynthesis